MWISELVDFFYIGNRIEDMTHTNKKGFTLIELLIVIGILAILATAVILILNPAELFRQARDSQRISDMATMKSALAFYLSTVGFKPGDLGAAGSCYVYNPASVALSAGCGGRHATVTNVSRSSLKVNDPTVGWVPVNFDNVPGGAPLSVLPKDPSNDIANGFYYSYVGTDAGTFELDANMESGRYSYGVPPGKDDVESVDGGNKSDLYEVGTDPGLDL